MEKRNLNICFNKSGSGSISTKLALPSTWIRKLGITETQRGIVAEFDGENIVIKKLNTLSE